MLLAVVIGAFALPAEPAAAAVSLEVEAGYAGGYVPGRPVPVRITIEADRLLRGRLLISAEDGAEVRTEQAVEVPAGSKKQFLVVVSTNGFRRDDKITVRLVGDEDASGEADVDYRDDRELVGLLPAIRPPALPSTATIAMGGTAEFVAVDDLELAAAPDSLASLGTIIVGPDELAGLDATFRQGLMAWVTGGGRLLVDALVGTKVTGLPDAWQPGDRDRAVAGVGEVRLTGGAAAAGQWGDVVEPTPLLTQGDVMNMGRGGWGFEGVADSVARDAGLKFVSLAGIIGLFALYIVLVGPLCFLLLRRTVRRPELAWAAIPVLAVVFAGLTFAVGTDLRRGTRSAHGSVIETTAAGATVTSYIGMVSRNGGDGHVQLPAGWRVASSGGDFGGGFMGFDPFSNGNVVQANTTVVMHSQGADAAVALDAGQFGLVMGRGQTAVDGELLVAAVNRDDEIGGVVRNTTSFNLEEVVVFVGETVGKVGRLAPGEEKTFEVGGRQNGFNGPPIEVAAWPSATGFNGPPDRSTIVSVAMLSTVAQQGGPNFRMPGVAVAVGWTRDFSTPASAGGDQPGRTAVIGRAPVTVEGAKLDGMAVRRELLRVSGGVNGPPMGGDALFRFTLPMGAPADQPRELVVPGYIESLSAWMDGQWVPLGDRIAFGEDGMIIVEKGGIVTRSLPVGPPSTATTIPAPGPPPSLPPPPPDIEPPPIPVPMPGPIPGRGEDPFSTRTIPLPDGAGAGGVLFVKARLSNNFGPADGTGFELRGAR